MARLDLVQHADRGADLTWRAVAALETVVLDEGLLDRMQRGPVRQARRGRDGRAVAGDGQARQVVTRRPSRSTVHAPHCPWSQPFFGDMIPSRSRSASSSVVRVSTVSEWLTPSTVSEIRASILGPPVGPRSTSDPPAGGAASTVPRAMLRGSMVCPKRARCDGTLLPCRMARAGKTGLTAGYPASRPGRAPLAQRSPSWRPTEVPAQHATVSGREPSLKQLHAPP